MFSISSKGAASAMAGHRMLIAEIGALDLFVLADLRGRARSDHASIDQNTDAVGQCEHGVHVMLDKHDGNFTSQLLQKLHHARGFSDAKSRHWLVQQQ